MANLGLKIGDRIKNIGPKENSGKFGNVINTNTIGVLIKYDDNEDGFCDFGETSDFYQIIKTKKSIMKKLNIMMKKLLDADTQSLVKAGYINGDLELTCEGKEALFTLMFDGLKADLVKLAVEKIAEEEKDN